MLTITICLGAVWVTNAISSVAFVQLVAVTVLFAATLNIRRLRRTLISDKLFRLYKRMLPQMSQTEQDAINAGSVWWDGDLFSGNPDWSKLLGFPNPTLTPEEKSFFDNETEELCRITSDWAVTNVYQDLPPRVWQYIKDKGFLGMIIPKKYGGKEFSAYMHSQVVMKLMSRCSALSATVMVPNSLGPAELLLHYGTEEQKNYYLPRLAKGLEIPCFALTNPNAGSDAASIPDFGIVCMGEWQGRKTLGLRVTWEKRYITLAPVATILGLAFRARDPNHLLGDCTELGITCALIPTRHPGVHIGRRHLPLNAVFQNGPNWGKDVFIPMDWIIGGQVQLGQGWKMLMNCLAAGRSISLPSSCTGAAMLAVRATGAYARVRSQFNMPIGKFEGVEEALTRMGGNLYVIDAARTMTAGAVDIGEKPSIISAIVKYHLTERSRSIVIDAMDILGGKGICLGPNNFMGRLYQQIPINITVEGANILTRSLIIFGQGAIRCHPYVLQEIAATREPDKYHALTLFDGALFRHIRFLAANTARALVMGLTRSYFIPTPSVARETRRYYQHLTRFSAAFAFLSDVSMFVLGGQLKRCEKLSARLGDILSLLYLCSATLKRYEAEGRQSADAPLMHWAMQDALFRMQSAFDGVISNFPKKSIARLLRMIIFPLGKSFTVPSDWLGHKVARLLIEPSSARDRLTAGMFIPRGEDESVGVLELALEATIQAETINAKIRASGIRDTVTSQDPDELAQAARAAHVITRDEQAVLMRARKLADEAIRVDDFPPDLGLSKMLPSLTHVLESA